MTNDARAVKQPKWSADTDGVDHININPRGKTELGRTLADFTKSHFVHPYFGPFNSMVGYWYYIKSENPDDSLRVLWGKSAAKHGKSLKKRTLSNFRELIFEGNYYKIDSNNRLKKLVIENTLPLALYYEFGPGNVVINPPSTPWLVPDYEKLAEMFKTGQVLPPNTYEDFQTK